MDPTEVRPPYLKVFELRNRKLQAAQQVAVESNMASDIHFRRNCRCFRILCVGLAFNMVFVVPSAFGPSTHG